VVEYPFAYSISIINTSLVKPGAPQMLIARASDQTGEVFNAGGSVTWSIDPPVAGVTVDGSGLATASPFLLGQDIWFTVRASLDTTFGTGLGYIPGPLQPPYGWAPSPPAAKPVIYLYPTVPTDVSVTLTYRGELDFTWPPYHDSGAPGGEGWHVTAFPDGTLINRDDGMEYSYLFWEGAETDIDFSRGFVVPGADTGAFLREKLAALGLTPREYNEFIVYWAPKMQGNAYNLISFQGESYTGSVGLLVTPEPDSLLRVFMAYRALDDPIDVPPQEIHPFERKGFTVVEWGGVEVKD
ncbi:MAG: hypothetical protein LBU58_01015, partial [Clostridiales bacterium]|nr:hypothetical protein [Clostridiales bacterium]